MLEALDTDEGDFETPLADLMRSSVEPLMELLEELPGTLSPVLAGPPGWKYNAKIIEIVHGMVSYS